MRKLRPRELVRKPVLFVVAVGSVLTTLSALIHPSVFTWVISVRLWLTVIFANFAEAVAEGRGRAQAESLRRAPPVGGRAGATACRSAVAHHMSRPVPVPGGEHRGRAARVVGAAGWARLPEPGRTSRREPASSDGSPVGAASVRAAPALRLPSCEEAHRVIELDPSGLPALARWFPVGQPGVAALAEHVLATGNGRWWADRPDAPRVVAVSCGNRAVLRGDAQGLPLAASRAVFSRVEARHWMVYVKGSPRCRCVCREVWPYGG
ncbi:hypothetical protein [Streptomyces sp. NPDC059566]|uniref:hypothetical protein n=1 Tax=Streptomyces sp. NPDC059566 TaxID=3346866 RepID=UPI00369B73C3